MDTVVSPVASMATDGGDRIAEFNSESYSAIHGTRTQQAP